MRSSHTGRPKALPLDCMSLRPSTPETIGRSCVVAVNRACSRRTWLQRRSPATIQPRQWPGSWQTAQQRRVPGRTLAMSLCRHRIRLGVRMRRLARRVQVRARGSWLDMRGIHLAGCLAARESVARRRMRLMATMLAGPCSPGRAMPKSRVFDGHPARVARARRFVAAVLKGCAFTETAVLLASELVTNALAHTPSGTGGSFEVIVWRDADAVLVAVLDDGSDRSPATVGVDLESESGRGLGLVAALADRWGHEGGAAARAVWFLLNAHEE
jgi:anti-sigma regulatory factor (Ser/Thr protein kinase)